MLQVAGWAGRKGQQGKVLIQTYDEENHIFPYTRFLNEQAREIIAQNPPNRIE